MNPAPADQIARAVLYEGYILYPYRPSSVKNRQRWTFGGIYPRAYSESQQGSDAWAMQAQCLVTGPAPAVTVAVRFLHLLDRTVERAGEPTTPASPDPAFHPVPALDVAGRNYQGWQEAVERSVELGEVALADLLDHPRRQRFTFPDSRAIEPLVADGQTVGRLVRQQQRVDGAVEISTDRRADGVCQLTVRVVNDTPLDDAAAVDRDAALMRALASTHMILGVRDGAFPSPTDPPPPLQELAAACQNLGCWPVLVGAPGQTDTLLASPIILYDYPQVAPESPGDLFDGCEIDEILTLRILTMTDDEKREAAETDPRAADMLARTEALAREQMMNLHGALRDVVTPTTTKPTEARHG